MKSIFCKRIVAFLIDFVPICVLFYLIMNYIMMTAEKSLLELVNNGIYYAVLFLFGLLWLFKDAFNGASIGKRMMKIKIVDKNNQKPSIHKLILRNLTLGILPLEVYFLLSKKIRFGDKITNTQVIEG